MGLMDDMLTDSLRPAYLGMAFNTLADAWPASHSNNDARLTITFACSIALSWIGGEA